MSKYFPETKSLGGNVKFELDLSNYAKKLCNRRQLADLVSLKLNIDKLDISKLEYHVV